MSAKGSLASALGRKLTQKLTAGMESCHWLAIHSLVGGPVSDGQSGTLESLIFSTESGLAAVRCSLAAH